MFERIDGILRDIENINEEINIILNMANITFIDYVMIKRGEQERPEGLGEWSLASLDGEVAKLRDAISSLNKIKKEVLTF